MEEMWLARDANNELYLFIDKVPPKKKREKWTGRIFSTIIDIPKRHFHQVQWSDEEPTKVKIVIEKKESNNTINKLCNRINATQLLSEVFMLVSPSLTNSEAFNYASTILCELDKRKKTRN